MKILNMLVYILLSVFSVSAYAQQSDKYESYVCQDTPSCSGNCQLRGKSVSFLINKEKSIVMAQFFENGRLSASETHDDCKVIFNEENWDCSYQMPFDGGTIWAQIRMTNGIYMAQSFVFRDAKKGLSFSVLVNICAKKR